ncbi:unnamed protein product [Sympodiomycopsis kandeliae]
MPRNFENRREDVPFLPEQTNKQTTLEEQAFKMVEPTNPTDGTDPGSSATRDRFPAPPKSLLTILETFMETQERRVNLWKEYQEAMEGHLNHSEVPPPASNVDSEHYNSDENHKVSLQDSNLMTRIISLVTSGLLDCSHETRTIALQLKDHSESESTDQEDKALSLRLSGIINKVQDTENEILKAIVRRDTIRRVAKGEQRILNSEQEAEVQEIDDTVKQLREEKVQEYVDDIRAEMTDLKAAS